MRFGLDGASVVLLVVTGLVTAGLATSDIEQELGRRAQHALATQPGLSASSVTVQGRDAILSGQTVTPESGQAARQVVQTLPGIRTVTQRWDAVPEIRPFAWFVTVENGRLMLEGAVPVGEPMQDLSARLARASGYADPDNRLRAARGIPEGLAFAAAIEAVGQWAGRLQSGRIEVVDRAVTVTGTARDPVNARALRADVAAALPAGLQSVRLDLTPPVADPFVFEAVREGGSVRLGGYLPDETLRNMIRDRAGRQFLGERLDDRAELARGASPDLPVVATLAMERLSRLAKGTMRIEGRRLVLQGQAPTSATAQALHAAPSLPAGWTYASEIGVQAPGAPLTLPACQAEVSALIGRGRLLFEVGRATLYRDSQGLIDHLAQVLARCPGASLEIAGHTDDEGPAEASRDLSRRRAEAVAEALRAAGVEPRRLVAVGYGAARPLVPNDSAANKARNRRIDFLLRP